MTQQQQSREFDVGDPSVVLGRGGGGAGGIIFTLKFFGGVQC